MQGGIGDALAAVAVTSTAFAQNVTISGRIDAGTVSSKTTGTNPALTNKSSTLAGANGTKTGSRITFAGTEDLGGGLTAFFNIESSLNNSVIGNRNLFVGARGSFGSVQIGRYLNTYSAVRDSHYSIAGGAGGAFLNKHLGYNLGSATVGAFGQAGLLVGGATGALVTATSTVGTGGVAPTNFFVRGGDGSSANAWQQLYATTTQASGSPFATRDGLAATSTSLVTINTEAGINSAARADNAAMAAQLTALMANGLPNRSNNTIAYTSPSFNGLTVTAGISDDRIEADRQDAGRTGKNETKLRGQSVSFGYANGPLSGRLTMGSGKVTTESEGANAGATAGTVTAIGDSSAKTSDTALMVSYNFGVAQAYIMNNRTKATLTKFRGAAANANLKTNATEIGVKAPMGAFEPFATIGRGKVTAEAGGAQTANIKSSAYQLGVNYTLSKRTHVYASTGQEKFVSSAPSTVNTTKTTGYSIGLVHNF